MRASTVLPLGLFSLLLLAAMLPARAADTLLPILNSYTNFAMTSDGIPEINSLSYLYFESGYAAPPPGGRLVLVLVEPRILAAAGDLTLRTQLFNRLLRFKGDLRGEGYFTRFIQADVYRGSVQKDGRTVLALRRFFIDVKAAFPNFEGAILVGNFPESSLVRRVSWAQGGKLAIGTELVSPRTDIILADLNGNWESRYRQGPFTAQDISATPDAATAATAWCTGESVRNCIFSSNSFSVGVSPSFRDAFYLDDAVYSILTNQPSPPLLRLRLYEVEHNYEVNTSDRSFTNILAHPDITVSRINAFHIAVNPNPGFHGSGGETFLDTTGLPQIVNSPMPMFDIGLEHYQLFVKDFNLERQLLVSYFDRNHRYRDGAFSKLPFRGGVCANEFDPAWYTGLVNNAATDFAPPVSVGSANLLQYVNFLKTPAVLKYLIGHSDSRVTLFADGASPTDLTTAVGGAPLRWIYTGSQYIPSFEGIGGVADMYVHRALWQYNALRNAGASLMIHGGCEVNSISESQTDVYSSNNYGRWSNSEGLLFYTNCVALFSRAKVFNDSPDGFTSGFRLAGRPNLGNCWTTYYNTIASDASLRIYNIQRKRAYFWSLNGDWTLRLRNANGIGILGFPGALRSTAVHPNNAWIDGWNYTTSMNTIQGIGDIDADTTDEFVINSDWGLGILKYNGVHFKALLTAPRDTWFGGWRYDATINPGRDRFMGVDNFVGSTKSDILLWSSWGMSTLEYTGTTLYPNRLYPNGTVLGSWTIDTANDTYWGCGHFNTDGRKDMVVTNPSAGLGIVSPQTNGTIFTATNGTRLGDWLLNTADNTIRLIGDFDGDRLDEILITSPWGIGVLKMVGGALTTAAIHPNGANLNGYIVSNTDNFAVADAFSGPGKKRLLVTKANGLYVLQLTGSSLLRQVYVANEMRIGGWLVQTSVNNVYRAGDVNGDTRAEFLIRSPWGVGIMGLDATGHVQCYGLYAYNSMLYDWYLQTGDGYIGAGNLAAGADRKELLFVKP